MLNSSSAGTKTGDALTPLDGRNFHKVKDLSQYFSESALYKYRLHTEIKYFEMLSKKKLFNIEKFKLALINKLVDQYNEKEFLKIKQIESKVSHDVKAVEYYLREKFNTLGLKSLTSYIHLGLTSEDTNNLSYGLMLKEFKDIILVKELMQLTSQLHLMAKKYKNIPMLGRTHGQPAVATTVGKELANYYLRLMKQFNKIKNFKFEGKCNGAVGNHNALKVALSSKDWMEIGKDFVKELGLIPNLYTTQILFYDNWIEFFQTISLINGILTDLSINVWQYIMLEVFAQKKKENEVGSSTMPQKINPINFENAEGNLQLANSMFQYFERKLIRSRLQRDLSDSTVRRNFGEALGYSVLGWRNIQSGLNRLSVNSKHLKEELNNHWEILTEAIQTVLRLKNDTQAYEKLKKLSRGKKIDKEGYSGLLKSLGLEDDERLKKLTPEKYTGYAEELCQKI